VIVAEYLPAGLHHSPIGQRCRLHAAAGPIASFEHNDVSARSSEVSRRGQPTEPGTHHGDVDQLLTPNH
jgi:hypothetical protein